MNSKIVFTTAVSSIAEFRRMGGGESLKHLSVIMGGDYRDKFSSKSD